MLHSLVESYKQLLIAKQLTVKERCVCLWFGFKSSNNLLLSHAKRFYCVIVWIIANEVDTPMMLFLALIPGGLTEAAGGFGCVPHLTASWDTGTVVASGKQEKINTGIITIHLHSHFDSSLVPFSFSLLFLNATAGEHRNSVCTEKKKD